MPTDIKLKNSVTATNTPTSLQQGEVAINVTDRKVWVGNAATTPVQLLGAGATGSFSALSCTTLTASGVATFSAGTVSAPAITTTGDTNTGIFFPAADTIAFTKGGVEAMRIDSISNVGISVTPSAWAGEALQIGLYSGYGIDANGNALMANNAYNDTSSSYRYLASSLGAGLYQQAFGLHQWFTAPSGTAGNVITFSERMRIDSAGNVGIGTNSPAQKLDVVGNASVSSGQLIAGTTTVYSDGSVGTPRLQWRAVAGTYVGAISIADTANNIEHLVLRNTNGNIASIGTNGTSFIFNTAATERMRIDSNGNVGIGTTATGSYDSKFIVSGNAALTSTGNKLYLYYNSATNHANLSTSAGGDITFTTGTSSPTERMRINTSGYVGIGVTSPDTFFRVNGVVPNANTGVAIFSSTGASDSASCAVAITKTANDSTTSQVFIRFGINSYNAGNGQINANGASQAAFGSFSDSRLKENIKDLPPQLANITALRPVEFDYIES
jgi:hypothetical protein